MLIVRIAKVVFLACALWSSPKLLFAQEFDPLSPDGAIFTAAVMAMFWLGAEQGVIENCGGDVTENAERLVQFMDAARSAHGGLADVLPGMFGEGMILGFQAGCNAQKLQIYGDWADMYYTSTLMHFFK